MPKIIEVTATYSRTVQVQQYEPERAEFVVKAVFPEGEEADEADLKQVAEQAISQVEYMLGIEGDGTAKAEVEVVSRDTEENPTSAPASAGRAAGGSRRTTSQASNVADASEGENPTSVANAAAASGGTRKRTASSAPASTASDAEAAPKAGRRVSSPQQTAGATTGDAPATTTGRRTSTAKVAEAQPSVSEGEYKLTDVVKACSALSQHTGSSASALELLEQFGVMRADQLPKEQYTDFVEAAKRMMEE